MRTPARGGGRSAADRGAMSLVSDLIAGPEDMKTTPGKMNSSRSRKSQNPNSIYVPPALRKRRSEASHKSGPDAAGSAPPRPPPRREAPVSKKCENSYMLFGLEDRSDPAASVSAQNVVKQLKENASRPKVPAPVVKKCDNSYLLFDAVEPPEGGRTRSRTAAPPAAESRPRVRCRDAAEPPDDLSCGVGSLSVRNKPAASPPSSLDKDHRSPTACSQKKCDNSYFLFDGDSIDDSKYSATPYRDKTHNQPPSSTNPASHPPGVASDRSVKLAADDRRSNQDNRCTGGEDMMVDGKAGDGAACPELSDNIEDYVVEIYDFPKTLRTQDMMTVFSCYVQDGFFVKWVDETHALGVFSTPFGVADVLKKRFDMVSVRALSEACPASVEAASVLPVPSASRPRTCPSSARRLIGGALGLRILVSDEIKQAEKKMLQDAKEERRLAARQRDEAWDGTIKSNLPPS